MTEPRTEAGRILLREHSSGTPHMARHILAIEAEAALRGTQVEGGERPEWVTCGIDGCDFTVEYGEGRMMALHKDEDHPAALSSQVEGGERPLTVDDLLPDTSTLATWLAGRNESGYAMAQFVRNIVVANLTRDDAAYIRSKGRWPEAALSSPLPEDPATEGAKT